jgi:hypothetical protein
VADETIPDDRTTKDRATDVATTARDEVRDVAGDARGEASAVVAEAGTQAHHLADEARTAVRRQASDGTSRAAGAVDQLAGRLRALAAGDPDQAGDLRRYAQDLGDRLGGVAGRMNDRGLDGLVEDVQRFARRRPALFLAVTAAAGFAAGRVFRGATAEPDAGEGSSGNGSSDSSMTDSRGGPPAALVAAGPDPRGDEQAPATAPDALGAEPGRPEGAPLPEATPYGDGATPAGAQ